MSSPAHRPTSGRRIIATDDSTSKLSAVVETLRDAGHCVFAAYDGVSALELVAQLPDVDLLVTNTRLGIVDGLELMRRTRELRPSMPILHIVHLGQPDGDAPPNVLTLREPFTPEQLRVAVSGLVK